MTNFTSGKLTNGLLDSRISPLKKFQELSLFLINRILFMTYAISLFKTSSDSPVCFSTKNL